MTFAKPQPGREELAICESESSLFNRLRCQFRCSTFERQRGLGANIPNTKLLGAE
jgi:hypothetical protein